MKYIKDLHEGEAVSDIYLCKKVDILKTKAQKDYMNLTLCDKTGTVNGKVWDINSSGIDHFEANDYIFINATVTVFQNSNQLHITRIRRAREEEYDVADYMPKTEKNVDDMYRELTGIIATIKNPYLKELLNSFYGSGGSMEGAYKTKSAAKTVHHAFVGGLLEHTLSVTKLCVLYADMYPVLSRDLLVSAAILHDIGKTRELTDFPENDYTDEGNLLGHIYMGAEMVSRRADEIEGFPAKLKGELVHCILAHHGELEFGSPKKPALAEAIALNQADNLDAKMEQVKELFAANASNDGWLGFQKFLDGNFRKTSID